MYDSFRIFSAIVTAIFLEAMPFLAVGALLSAVIEVLVPSERLTRCIPKGRMGGIALGIGAGMILPTCECGVVPVVRRLMRKGVPAHVAIPYMLSAPIVNPVVLISTWFAFPGKPSMVLARVLVAAAVATVAGLVAGRMKVVLSAGVLDDPDGGCCDDDHHHHEPRQEAGRRSFGSVLLEILRQGCSEFLDMGKFLILGAIAAGIFKTFLPQELILVFAENIFLQILGMMILAFLLSVCSEADAFVAASFQIFSPASQLAFITIGPMIDLKLIGMYAVSFRRPFFWFLMIVPAVLVFVLSLLAGVFL
jgi:uncharacterized membrane protein YraQ (UPF0718 family)